MRFLQAPASRSALMANSGSSGFGGASAARAALRGLSGRRLALGTTFSSGGFGARGEQPADLARLLFANSSAKITK